MSTPLPDREPPPVESDPEITHVRPDGTVAYSVGPARSLKTRALVKRIMQDLSIIC